MEMRLKAQQGQNEETARQIAALRAEIAALRDTSTQYDMATDGVVQGLAGRLSRLESRGRAPVVPAAPPDETQRLGLR
jgi:hypothetical protein